MTKEEALLWFGSQHKLAKFLGVAQSNVSGWKQIPPHHQRTIELHTQGELMAEDENKRCRYQCVIQKKYLNELDELSNALKLPVVEVLRRAIHAYYRDRNPKRN